MIKNILVIRFSSLGDIVLTTGVLKHVKECRPDINIDVITMSHFAQIYDGLDFIRSVYCIDKGCKVSQLVDTLNTMPDYDYIFDLHSNLRSRIVKLVLPARNSTYKKNSLARRLYVKYRICKYDLRNHVVTKYYNAFRTVLKLEKVKVEQLRPFLSNPIASRDTSKKTIVTIHPFASKNTKIWEYFVELAKVLINNGLHVRFIGDGNIEIPNGVENKTGHTPLNTLIRNIADSDIVVTTDSGPLHIATALNIPTVAIFGATSKEFGFYPEFNNCKVVELTSLKCRPCHVHGSDSCPRKHFKCMRDITVEEVRHNIEIILKK